MRKSKLFTFSITPFLDIALSGTKGDFLSTNMVLDRSGAVIGAGLASSAERGVRRGVCCKPFLDSARGTGEHLRGMFGTKIFDMTSNVTIEIAFIN